MYEAEAGMHKELWYFTWLIATSNVFYGALPKSI